MQAAKRQLADFDEIYATEPGANNMMARLLRPRDTVAYHEEAREFIRSRLAVGFPGETVVVTHYAPYPRSIHQRHVDAITSAAFASNLEDVITEGKPVLWVHGHVHNSFDYELDGTRILCNPRGYGYAPNPDFNPGLVVDLCLKAEARPVVLP